MVLDLRVQTLVGLSWLSHRTAGRSFLANFTTVGSKDFEEATAGTRGGREDCYQLALRRPVLWKRG